MAETTKPPIGVRVYEFIHGKDAPFKKGEMVPHEPKGEDKKESQAGGSSRRATTIDRAERRALGYAEGGPIVGPGGPTEDAVPINASNGEFVIPAAVAQYLGTGFFERLIKKTEMEMAASRGAPGPFDDMAVDEGGDMVPGGMPSAPPRRA